MENIMLNTEHQIKTGISKQKKTKKTAPSFLELLKQGEKIPESQPQVKNQKSVSKTSGISKQDTKNVSEKAPDNQILINAGQTEDAKQTREIPPHAGQSIESPAHTQELGKKHIPQKDYTAGTVSLVKDASPDKNHSPRILDTKLTKEFSEPDNRLYHIMKEREGVKLTTNLLNLQSEEKSTDEKSQADRGVANSNVQKNKTVSGQEGSNQLSTADKNFKIVEKQESGSPGYNITQNTENYNRENLKKLTAKDPQAEKNYGIKNQDTRNIKEPADQQFNISRSTNEGFTRQETGEHPISVLTEAAKINQEIRHNSGNTQETARLDFGQEIPFEAGIPAGEFLADGRSYSGENMNNQHQPSSSQQPAIEKTPPQNRFNISFSFMDTKINIQAVSNSMVMHINTSQVIDPSTVEKIRQILLENGFTNHNLIVRDRTKTAKVYTTNRAYTENRNSDGFKISA